MKAPQSPRHGIPAPPARRRRPARLTGLRCEHLEDRLAPALFNAQTPYVPSGANNNGCVAVADFNKDGRPDAVLTNYGTSENSGDGNAILVLYRNASGSFTTSSKTTAGTNVSFATVADINGDTWPDLLVSNGNQQGNGTVSVFRNDGVGNLVLAGTPFSTFGNNASWVGTADMTGDGVLDVVVTNFGRVAGESVTGNNITVFQGIADGQGRGNFTFSNAPIATLSPQTSGVNAFVSAAAALADFDGDGFQDIAAAVMGIPPDDTSPHPPGNIYAFKGTGSGGFATAVVYETGGVLPTGMTAADLNKDGKKDLIIANAGHPVVTPEFNGNSVGVLLNGSTPGNLGFSPLPISLTANCYGTFAVAVADFNMDGNADIAAVNHGFYQNLSGPAAFVSVYQGNGTGTTFTPASPGTYDTRTNFGGGQYLAVGDFDGNGTPDVVVAHATNRVGVLLNTSTPQSSQPTVSEVKSNDGAAQRSRVTSLTVTFSGQVTFTGGPAAAFQLRQAGSSTNVGVTVDLTGSTSTQTVAKLTFNGQFTENASLADGNYTLMVLSSQITGGLQTGDSTTNLHRLYGDFDGNKAVNGADFAAFRAVFGANPADPGLLAAFDFDGNGAVNGADFARFRANFGQPALP